MGHDSDEGAFRLSFVMPFLTQRQCILSDWRRRFLVGEHDVEGFEIGGSGAAKSKARCLQKGHVGIRR